MSDRGNTIGARIGILTEPSDEAKVAQATRGLVVASTNADGTAGVPMPTALIVDREGAIRWIDVHPDYSTRTEPGDILAAYDAVYAATGR